MAGEFSPTFKINALSAFEAVARATPPCGVTTFPGGWCRHDPLKISANDRYGLVDVTAFGKVDVCDGEVEILDASGHSEVTITGGTVHFLELAGASSVRILGGKVEYLSVGVHATATIIGSDLRLFAGRITGVLANGATARIRLAARGARSVHLRPVARSSFELVTGGDDRWGRAG